MGGDTSVVRDGGTERFGCAFISRQPTELTATYVEVRLSLLPDTVDILVVEQDTSRMWVTKENLTHYGAL